jgi:predicted nuclease with TOPRIM domain
MEPTIIVAIVAGLFNIAGIIISTKQNNKDITSKLEKHQAVQEERISNLTDEVRKHNGFAERIPRLEVTTEQVLKDVGTIKQDMDKNKEKIIEISSKVESIEECQCRNCDNK